MKAVLESYDVRFGLSGQGQENRPSAQNARERESLGLKTTAHTSRGGHPEMQDPSTGLQLRAVNKCYTMSLVPR